MKIGWRISAVVVVLLATTANPSPPPESSSSKVLVDYSAFPGDWKIKGDAEKVGEVYQVLMENGERILSVKVSGDPIRVFKKIAWDSFRYPVLTWRWKVLRWPEEQGASVDLYVSLHRDTFGIPSFVKYVWSDHLPVGTEKSGGFFRPSEVVVRSGLTALGEWTTEKIDVLESFRRIHGSDPDPEAYGIGLWVASGVEMEISEIVAQPGG